MRGAGRVRLAVSALTTLSRFVVVELLVRVVELERAARVLGASLDGPELAGRQLTAEDRRAVRRAQALGRRWPLGRGPCLRETLVIAWMLRRHGPVLRLGVRRDGDAVTAHAWLDVAGQRIGDAHDYRELHRAVRDTS